MKTDKELEFIPREEYMNRLVSLQNAVNPKPYTEEEISKKKEELLRKQNR